MPAFLSRRSKLLLIPLAVVVIAMAGVYAAVSAGYLGTEGSRPPSLLPTRPERPAVQSNATRAAQLRADRAESYDSAYESCKELGLGLLARQLKVAPTPAAVANGWARTQLPAFHAASVSGCRDALSGRAPPLRKPGSLVHAEGP